MVSVKEMRKHTDLLWEGDGNRNKKKQQGWDKNESYLKAKLRDTIPIE